MNKKVFISYSHKDKSYREDLDEHLSMLKRNGVISVWHDRKLSVGDDWKQKIDDNLEAADIIIFLISPSFLASDYCFDIEVKRAMERHGNGTATIVSIMIRNCDWHDCEFARFQVIPEGARPISLWDDKDTAWLDAINKLKKLINEFLPNSSSGQISAAQKSITPSEYQREWLDDTEIVLTHRKVDKVKLSDVYVSPDIEFFDEIKNDEIDIVDSDVIFRDKSYYLLSGEEQQGKTTLLKHGVQYFLKKGYLPLYIDAKLVNKSDLDKVLKREVERQFQNLSFEQYQAFSNKVLFIDNFDEIGLNLKFQNVFLDSVKKYYDWVVITCHTSFNYLSSEIPIFNEYTDVKILDFGHQKREEIAQKWISLGVEESIDDSVLYAESDEMTAQLNAVIKKNIVPAKPIYVLILMQMFEVNTQQDRGLTSYGHCYQHLIYQCFEKAGIKGSEYEKYLNVLTELAWAIFKQEGNINMHQLDEFFDEYDKTFLPVDRRTVLSQLTHHSILEERDSSIGFKYPYIYYFFTGKKIAESFSESAHVKEQVHRLLEYLHREDFANILIFITHHTKDAWVIGEINSVLSSLFKDQEKATLTKDELSFMSRFLETIPDLVIEQREIHKERESHNKNLDAIERNQAKEELEPLDTLANINKTFRGMEVAGQIIRNRHASMTRDSLYKLAYSGTSTGLRFLDYFMKISDSGKNEIINFITQQLAEHPNQTNIEIKKQAEKAYHHMTYSVINGVIKKIASSIGSKEAKEIYSKLENEEETPAFILISLSISLQFTRSLDIKIIEQTVAKIKNNPVCMRILKEMIIQHIYMFPIEYKTKQKLAELLKISVQGQNFMDLRKLGKG